MKIAYLILAHNDWALLNKLLSCLDDVRNSIFIHIDKKADFHPDDIYVLKKAKYTYIKRRKVSWGGWSMIAAEMDLITAAIESDRFDHLHLLSGQDLPLKTSDEIHEWFDNHQGKNFIGVNLAPEYLHNTVERISLYWVFQDYIGRNKSMVCNRLRGWENRCRDWQRKHHINRMKKLPMKRYIGTQWFSITDTMAKEILKYRKKMKKWFGWSCCADEIFVQTIAYNSPLKDTIVNNSLRFIDWKRGNPYIYTKEDADLLLNSQQLFARKFSTEVDAEIIDIICTRVNGAKNDEN